MSLAMTAASFENDNNQNSYSSYNDTPINKKRQSNIHNKTQKRMTTEKMTNEFNQQKVNSVLASIHNRPIDDDDVGNYNPNGLNTPAIEEFKPLNPLAPPYSMGTERTKKQEGMTNIDNNFVPKPVDETDLELQELQSNFMNDAQVRDYYKKLVPNYSNNSNNNKSYYSQSNMSGTSSNLDNQNNQVLIEKLNYMINLLEEQQDQKTNNVAEEVVLYSFLGIFIIFIVDSFARVGKYVR
jgi:hypothetical protein